MSHFTNIRLAYGLKYVLDYKCSEEEIPGKATDRFPQTERLPIMQTVSTINVADLKTHGAIRKAFKTILEAARENNREIFEYTKKNQYTMSEKQEGALFKASENFTYNETDCIEYREESREWQKEEGIADDETIKRDVNIKYWQDAVASEIKIFNEAMEAKRGQMI